MTSPLLQAADLRGAARLTTEAVIGIADLVEALHARIVHTPGLRGLGMADAENERTRGLTGFVYRSVRGVTRLAGGGAEALLGALGPLLAPPQAGRAPRPEREAVVAALNGVLGDHLAASGNPLAIEMSFRDGGRALPLDRPGLHAHLPQATPRVLVLVHGLCMNDLQWRRQGHHHGDALARDLGYTPVHLHYNSGLGVPDNGRRLAALMQRLLDAWPVPVQRLAIIGHSMGGLVARSAIHQATLPGGDPLQWPARLDDLVCLGTPHLGAPLERAGHGIDTLLAALPYAAPLARLGQVRSAGITDLRHGRVADPLPGPARGAAAARIALPEHARCHAVAARLGAASGRLRSRLGDGLVPVASALGEHRDPARRIGFSPERQALIDDTGHFDLLCSPEVLALLQRWLR